MPISKSIFEYRITVQQEHLDDLQHVNNVVYVQFMQDVAGRHWNSKVVKADADQVIWMVRKHEIEYLAQAFLDDELIVRTWTGENTSVTWDRHYEIIRIADQKKIIIAKSIWVLLDKQNGRPKRIEDRIIDLFV